VVLTDIYAASEDPIPGIDIESLARTVARDFGGELQTVKALADVPKALARAARPGDLIVLLGAGSIGSIWPSVLSELERSSNH
jgi:UDP-N-acetylmuramate--alanine ligase